MIVLQFNPPMGHVVKFHFHSFGGNQEKGIRCIDQNHNSVKLILGEINTLNHKGIYTN